jgi:hypothetical protein
MNEIVAGLCGLSFSMIRQRRGSRFEELSGDVIASPAPWELTGQAYDVARIIEKPFFQIVVALSIPITLSPAVSMLWMLSVGC